MDLIDRQAAIDAVRSYMADSEIEDSDWHADGIAYDIRRLPTAQPNLSEAYSKAVFTWVMDYQIRAAELKGRYTPYEVLSWVINDWRKENG